MVTPPPAYSEKSLIPEYAESFAVNQYTRRDVLRILHLQTRQLLAWERAGLVEAFAEGEEAYTFVHLRRLATLKSMAARNATVRQMRAGEEAMERMSGVGNALVATGTEMQGRALRFRLDGTLVDPVTQQMAFDFAMHSGEWMQGELQVVNARRTGRSGPANERAAAVQEMFLKGVRLEERTSTVPEAIAMYEALLELAPHHAQACINLGTILYNQREFSRAEEMYRRATEAEPDYALAFFDLGNVLDETQKLDEAIEAYERAILLVPGYADAHYNLALAFERKGEHRRALRHWTAYMRLDPGGPWSAHARDRARKILSTERLTIVSRGGRAVASAG